MIKKLLRGKGFNSEGHHKTKIGGTNTSAYKTWYSMLSRCYSAKLHARHPTYIGCSVSDEWLDYQNFAEWFENHEHSNLGYELDKDLLLPGNKIYAPDRCVFVPRRLNTLLLDNGASRGQYKQGVYFNKNTNKFRAQIYIGGKKKNLGNFNTELEAYQAYKKAKEANVKRMALKWQDRIASDVFDALMRWELNPK